MTQQGLQVGWVSEAATTQHRFENASKNLTLFLDVKVDSLPEACTWTQHFDLTVPGMPPTIFLTSCLSGGSPKRVISDKQKSCEKKEVLCKTRGCRTPAQTGHEGYCRVHFRKHFPEGFQDESKKRKSQCPLCGNDGELTRGICKPCTRARGCSICKDVNRDPTALVCAGCRDDRMRSGAKYGKLVLWCPKCTTHAERESGRCADCFKLAQKRFCDQCGTSERLIATDFYCSETACRTKVHYCASCVALTYGAACIQCKTCWVAAGKLCIRCNIRTARNTKRCCDACGKDFCAIHVMRHLPSRRKSGSAMRATSVLCGVTHVAAIARLPAVSVGSTTI